MRRNPSLEKAALSIFDQAVYSGTTFVTAVIVGRSTSPSELGIYYLTLTIVMVLFGVHDNVVSGPYTIFSARKRGLELAEYTGSMWAHHLVLTAVGMLAIVLMIGLSVATGAVDFMAGLWTLLLAGPLMLLREGIRRLSFARLRQSTAIALDITVSVLQIGGLASLWYLDRMSISGVFSVMGGACALASLGWFVLTPEPPRFVRYRFREDLRHNWAFAKWAVLSWLTVDTVPFVMPWIVDFAAGTAATGLYGACGTLVGVTNILVVGTGNFLRPKAAQAFSNGGVPALATCAAGNRRAVCRRVRTLHAQPRAARRLAGRFGLWRIISRCLGDSYGPGRLRDDQQHRLHRGQRSVGRGSTSRQPGGRRVSATGDGGGGGRIGRHVRSLGGCSRRFRWCRRGHGHQGNHAPLVTSVVRHSGGRQLPARNEPGPHRAGRLTGCRNERNDV